MDYIIIPKEGDPFWTKYFEPENNYEEGMVVIKVFAMEFYKNGAWIPMEVDHL